MVRKVAVCYRMARPGGFPWCKNVHRQCRDSRTMLLRANEGILGACARIARAAMLFEEV